MCTPLTDPIYPLNPLHNPGRRADERLAREEAMRATESQLEEAGRGVELWRKKVAELQDKVNAWRGLGLGVGMGWCGGVVPSHVPTR